MAEEEAAAAACMHGVALGPHLRDRRDGESDGGLEVVHRAPNPGAVKRGGRKVGDVDEPHDDADGRDGLGQERPKLIELALERGRRGLGRREGVLDLADR